MKHLLLAATALLLSACASDEPIPYNRLLPPTEAEREFVKTVLNEAQAKSFQNNREYCGYIGLGADSEYAVTPLKKGRKNSCVTPVLADDFHPLATFHTHGSFSEKSDSEYPSSDDLIGDIDEGLDGYISTPGGRLWYSDAQRASVILLCGEGCLLADEDYAPFEDMIIHPVYTLEDLKAYEQDNE